MATSPSQAAPWITLFDQQAASGCSLREQTCAVLRQLITSGHLAKGARLPSTRTLAGDLGISRVTAEAAYSQLEAEGYLRRRVGDGSYVAIAAANSLNCLGVGTAPMAARAALSARGEAILRGGGCRDPLQPLAFAAGSPDLRAFPLELWQQLTSKRLRREGEALLRYGDPQGYPPLRSAIAAYLNQSRGVRCSAEQVLVLTSSQQALQLVATLMLDAGDPVWLEEPGYRGARTAFAAMGADVQPVAVDGDGLDPARAPAGPTPRLIYLTPSHQYPTGVQLSLTRRLDLLDYAQRHDAWIVEDDYDSEFQYDGRPIPAMQGLDRHGRVLYVGTFSKVLFPSLRLAYLVLPPGLAERFALARTIYDGHSAQLAQAVTADFIIQGHFAAHLRQMRQLYRSRRDLLMQLLRQHLPELHPAHAAPGGLQLTVHLPSEQEARLTREAAQAGVATPGLASMYLGRERQDGWVLGYSALSNVEIAEGVRQLARLPAWKARGC
jgi:GntR family transcriptional regulator/MocR family aminotransferase